VPIFDYEKLFALYWYKLLDGQSNITWPGKVKYFGLTSGTSNDSSKRVPIIGYDQVDTAHGIRQLISLLNWNSLNFEKSVYAQVAAR
jgi:hypothetical protein